MKKNINTYNYKDYTLLEFPRRGISMLYNNITKKYNFYKSDTKTETIQSEQHQESPMWKYATLVVSGIVIGMLTILGILLIKMV